jgi:hypothetical protein
VNVVVADVDRTMIIDHEKKTVTYAPAVQWRTLPRNSDAAELDAGEIAREARERAVRPIRIGARSASKGRAILRFLACAAGFDP